MRPELPILYSFRRCPYAMRARMALHYSEIPVELREILLRDKPTEMIAASPKGTVPVLVLPDGTVIDESLAIMAWAVGCHDPEGWVDEQATEAESLIRRNDGEFKGWLDRYKYAEHFPDQPAREYRARGETFLAELDERLRRHEFLLSDRRTLADVALAPFVRQFAHVDLPWFEASKYEALRAWLTAFKASALFTGVMQKYPVWRAGDPPTLFGRRPGG